MFIPLRNTLGLLFCSVNMHSMSCCQYKIITTTVSGKQQLWHFQVEDGFICKNGFQAWTNRFLKFSRRPIFYLKIRIVFLHTKHDRKYMVHVYADIILIKYLFALHVIASCLCPCMFFWFIYIPYFIRHSPFNHIIGENLINCR